MAQEAPKSLRTLAAQTLLARRKEMASIIASHERPVEGHTRLRGDEERRQFWQVAEGWTPEQELALLGYGPDGQPLLDELGMPMAGLPAQKVGALKYPWRQALAMAGGRIDDEEAQVEYIERMAALGPPPPEPLEIQAQLATIPDPALLVEGQASPPAPDDPTGGLGAAQALGEIPPGDVS